MTFGKWFCFSVTYMNNGGKKLSTSVFLSVIYAIDIRKKFRSTATTKVNMFVNIMNICLKPIDSFLSQNTFWVLSMVNHTRQDRQLVHILKGNLQPCF